MSVLEIVLYSIIGLAVTIYVTKTILQIIDRKRHPQKYKNKDEKEQKELDE